MTFSCTERECKLKRKKSSLECYNTAINPQVNITDTLQQMETSASALMPVSAVLSARWRRFQPHVARTLTVGAGLVNKVAEVEQGGPGGQVLNEPLRGKRSRTVADTFSGLHS